MSAKHGTRPVIRIPYLRHSSGASVEFVVEPDLKDLARACVDMDYRSLMEFLDHISRCLHDDRNADLARGRLKLADALSDASWAVTRARDALKPVCNICRPYMEGEHENPAADREG